MKKIWYKCAEKNNFHFLREKEYFYFSGEKMAKRLTAKQQKFVEEICKGVKPSQAYINSYGKKNASAKTISVQAQKILKNPNVYLAIDENYKKLQEKFSYSREESFRKIQEIQQKAFEYKQEAVTKDGAVVVLNNPDLRTALKAEELKGKLVNLYSDGKNVEVSTAVQIVFNDNMKGL